MKRWCTLALVLTLLIVPVQGAEPTLSASSALLMDGASGRVLYEKDAHTPRPIASITKLMTALVAVRLHPDLSAVVQVRQEWTGAEGSSMYLKPGEELTLEALLYGLLLSSGNDAALAVAGFCAGDVASFVEEMNQTAADLGMNQTHFANPNGLDHPEHYSTAADMAILARAVLEQEELRGMVSTRSISIAGRTLTNHNKLLWQYEGCTGMKTGYTDEAGRTLVSSARREGQELIAVTLNAPNDWADHAALFDYGFAAFPSRCLVEEGQWADLPVTGSLSRFVRVVTPSAVWYPIGPGEEPVVELSLPDMVEAPVQAGFPAGHLTVSVGEREVARLPLVYAWHVAEDLAPKGWLERLFGS